MFEFIAGAQKWYKNAPPRTKLTATLLVISLLVTGIFLMMSGASDPTADPTASAPLYIAGVLVKFIAVLLLIVVCGVLFRRWMRMSPQGTTRQVRLLETVRLSPRQAIHLISVGDQQLLIGATDQNISVLSQLDGNFTAAPVEDMQSQPGLDFGSLVESFSTNQPKSPSSEKE